jgi:4-hydroxy-tetrahydrodipicolinate reductase
MKIALIGYGKMGKEIESIAKKRGHEIVLILDENNIGNISAAELKKAEAIIEFTVPHAAVDNIYKCFEAGVPVVVGTTGWHENLGDVMKKQHEKNGALFYSSNFSVGVNLFFQLNKFLSQLMEKHHEYEVSMEEQHHIHKKDAPSGTAITIAEDILANLTRKDKYSIHRSEDKAELFIDVVRKGEIPGTHIVKYQSTIDDIEIKHVAHNRQGFALGAVLAAEYMKGKTGIYGMKDLMGF